MVAESFPDPIVSRAYFRPMVAKSLPPDPRGVSAGGLVSGSGVGGSGPSGLLAWREPDVEGIRAFAAEMMGWSAEETDRALKPVLEQLRRGDGDRGQARLDSYYLSYHDHAKVASIRSERLDDAVKGRTRRAARKAGDTGGAAASDTARGATGMTEGVDKGGAGAVARVAGGAGSGGAGIGGATRGATVVPGAQKRRLRA